MDPATVEYIHSHLTEFFKDKEDPISPPGVKDYSTIESAAARPYATVGGVDAYPSIFMKAAALFHSIAGNHSFHNGNKRAALLSTLYFLGENGYIVDGCDDDEMYEFTRRIAAHELTEDRSEEVTIISDWLEANSRRQIKGEKPLKFGELKEILARFGYDVVESGKRYAILQDGVVAEYIKKKGSKGFEDYDPVYVAGLRKKLKLIPDNGCDSARFYGHKGISDELTTFVQLRIDVMQRLAKI